MRVCSFLLAAGALLVVTAQTAPAKIVLKVDVWGESNTPQQGFDDTIYCDAEGTMNPTVTTGEGITVTLDGLWGGRNRGVTAAPDVPPDFTEHGLLCDWGAPWTPGVDPRTITITGLEPNTLYKTSLWAWEQGNYMEFDLSANGILVKDNFRTTLTPTHNDQNRIDFDVTSDSSGTVVLEYSDPIPQPLAAVDFWSEWLTEQPGFPRVDSLYVDKPYSGGEVDASVTTTSGVTVTLDGLWGGRNRGAAAIQDNPPGFTEANLLMDFAAPWSDAGQTITISGLEVNKAYDMQLWAWEQGWLVGYDVHANGVQVIDDFVSTAYPTSNDECRMDFQATSDDSGVVVLSFSDPLNATGARYRMNALRIFDPEAEPQEPPSYRINALQMSTPPMAGDANNNGQVDEEDAAILASNWLKSSDAVWADGDFNGDGSVDDKDATLLAVNWHVGVPQSAVPEPSTICLVLSSLVVMLLDAKFFRRVK